MAAEKSGTREQVKVEYKVDYDVNGDFPNVPDFSFTLGYVKETATLDQKKAMADALVSLTIADGAPYKVYIVETSQIVVA